LWGESPVFGGLGGTFPPRLSPEGKRERGVQIPCARQANHRHASRRNLSSGIHPASPYCHSKAGIPLFVGHVNGAHESAFALDRIGFFDEVGALFAAHGDDAGFERGDLADAPLGVDNGLDEVVFVIVGGGIFSEEAVLCFW